MRVDRADAARDRGRDEGGEQLCTATAVSDVLVARDSQIGLVLRAIDGRATWEIGR